MNKDAVYLDYNATTPIRPEVITLMTEIMGTVGNASSVHGFGRIARRNVENARDQIGALARCNPAQVIFTSGATESNNAVVKAFTGQRVLISSIEHAAVCEAIPEAECIPVHENGLINMEKLEQMLTADPAPALLSIIMVNNETGVIQPVGEIARMARRIRPQIFVHTDAVQAAGRVPLDFPALNVDYMSLSAHKMGGPQGVGALIAAPGAKPAKLLHGGGQEKRQRAGTENVAGIAGFGQAAELAMNGMENYEKLRAWRDAAEDKLLAHAPELKIFGRTAPRVANTISMAMAGMPAETQLMNLDLAGFAVSSGSACSSGTFNPSRILKAMGATDLEAVSALRVSMGWNSKKEDIDSFVDSWIKIYDRMKDKIKEAALAQSA
ncbi:MAG: cysteine desulfurase family protein [Pseudomonadota bacterium]|nr:cysteine desulfurase family protein [Pseudomonadota bacterium]MEC8664607.1 cysteine desulfurase family protein [Pseudomonadota bacterium]